MNILHITPAYLPAFRYGGPIQSVHGLCKALAARKHHLTVATTNLDGSQEMNVDLNRSTDCEGVQVHYFSTNFPKKTFFSLSLDRFLRERIKKFDIVHCHSLFAWPTVAASHWALKHKIPFVISPRGMLVKELIQKKNSILKNAWLALFDKKLLRSSAGIHATTSSEMKDLKKFAWLSSNVFVIPNGIDFPTSEADFGFKIDLPNNLRDTKRLLFLGRISWKKALDKLVESLAYIQNTHLVIAGNDEENHLSFLKEQAMKCGVNSKIIFTGHLSSQEKYSLLRSSDALVLPSIHENFGNVVLEAMSVGCPVVVSKGVGLSDMVQETGVGIVTDNKPARMGEAINQLLQDKEQLQKMKQLGPQVIQERFSWPKIAEQMEQVYLQVLNRKNK